MRHFNITKNGSKAYIDVRLNNLTDWNSIELLSSYLQKKFDPFNDKLEDAVFLASPILSEKVVRVYIKNITEIEEGTSAVRIHFSKALEGNKFTLFVWEDKNHFHIRIEDSNFTDLI